jgi:hypothetical protein
VPLSRGSQQIMATLDGWKKLVGIVDSPANGITFDCGVTRELGEDPVAVCRWFGERDRINHVHYRNVRVRRPYVDYTEMFPDEGQVDMFAVMKELVRQKYPRYVYPEHPRALDATARRPASAPSTRAAAATRASSTTWPTRGRCCRRRSRRSPRSSPPRPLAYSRSQPFPPPRSEMSHRKPFDPASRRHAPPPQVPGQRRPRRRRASRSCRATCWAPSRARRRRATS